MISSRKLKRLKDSETEKEERKRLLLNLKQSTLPVFESKSRNISSKCQICCYEKESYGITYEWLCEPIDVLQLKKFSIFSSIMSALIVHPAQLQMIKFLQQQSMSIIFVMDSENVELSQSIIKCVMNCFNLKIPSDDLMKISSQQNSNILVSSNDSQFHAILNSTRFQENVHFLPISIAFEHVDKIPMSFIQKFVTGYGIVKISFHEPYKIQDFISLRCQQQNSNNNNLILNHLLHDIVFKAPVMATNLVAFLLLTYFKRDGGKIEDFVKKADELQRTFCTVDFAFEGDTIDVVNYALKYFRDKISIDKEGFIKAKDSAFNELRISSKTLLYHHAMKSALLSFLTDVDDYDRIDYHAMMDHAIKVIEKMAQKIPFKLCSLIQTQLADAFDSLVIDELLRKHQTIYTETQVRAQRLARNMDGIDEDDEDELVKINEFDPDNQVIINNDKEWEINVVKDMISLFS